METCAKCERDIGNLETIFVWKDQMVCSECVDRLGLRKPENAPAMPKKPDQPALDALSARVKHHQPMMSNQSQPSSDASMWAALRWLGFGMLVVGWIIHPLLSFVGLILWLSAGVVWMTKK